MYLNYKEHTCEVCGKEFIKDQVYCPRCPDCYKHNYVRLCEKCKKPMTEKETNGGQYRYHQKCFVETFDIKKIKK